MSFRAYRVKAELPGKKRPNLEVMPSMRGSKLNWYRVCTQLNSIYTEYKVNVVLRILSLSWIKGTQAWDKFEFFLTYIKSLYALRKFSKKNLFLFPLIFPRISMFEHFRGDWAYAEPNLLERYPTNYLFPNHYFGPIR